MENKAKVVFRVHPTRVWITLTVTSLMVIILILQLLLTVRFDITQLNLFSFTLSILNWLVGRITYFPIGFEMGMQEPDVLLVTNTLEKYRKIIFKYKINKEFRLKLDHHNHIAKAESYMNLIDSKLITVRDEKEHSRWEGIKDDLQNYLDFLNGKKPEYQGKIRLDSIDVKYDKTSFANMFSGGFGEPEIGRKYEINAYTRGLKYALPQFIYMLITSLLNAVMVVTQYGFKMEALLFFIIQLVMFIVGIYHGWEMGRRIAVEDKYQVLLNLSTLAKEIITELETESKVIYELENVG
jgi:hypothetical protein